MKRNELAGRIFSEHTAESFDELALEIFRYQSESVPVYRRYIEAIGINPLKVDTAREIPFLPIEFFRDTEVISVSKQPVLIFTSSSTTSSKPSRHCVADPNLYVESFLRGFQRYYGSPEQYCILALLPSYLDRPGSSLVYMMEELIRRSGHPAGGLYLNDHSGLYDVLREQTALNQKIFLFGATFALLDFAGKFPCQIPGAIIMETGGMKGRGPEKIREEVHEILINAFHVPAIHSEYGMTELLSQAYSPGHGIFRPVPWMRVDIRDINDPFQLGRDGETGGICITDLANLDSCSFIASQDLGRKSPEGTFEILGRFDFSDVRGCNLLVV
ncbi:MAG: acyl transferase [Bacteroidia bacterium]|nr:acyl transferase [Bacteroidia bacterium]